MNEGKALEQAAAQSLSTRRISRKKNEARRASHIRRKMYIERKTQKIENRRSGYGFAVVHIFLAWNGNKCERVGTIKIEEVEEDDVKSTDTEPEPFLIEFILSLSLLVILFAVQLIHTAHTEQILEAK